jgi:hypothetical protein
MSQWLRRCGVIAAAAVISACATSPPVQEMSDARQAIAAAAQAQAGKYAPQPFGDAQRFLAQAEQQLRREAYGPARANAVRAKKRAQQALEQTQAQNAAAAPQ